MGRLLAVAIWVITIASVLMFSTSVGGSLKPSPTTDRVLIANS